MKWEQFEQMHLCAQEFANKVLTDIECPKCGKYLFQRTDIILTSYPEQYQYECKCGFVGYSHAKWNDALLKQASEISAEKRMRICRVMFNRCYSEHGNFMCQYCEFRSVCERERDCDAKGNS